MISLVVLASSAGLAHAQDAAAGTKVFKKCMSCRAVGEGAQNNQSPELNGLIGRPAASAAGYQYSDAMKSSGLTWDEPTLAQYLKSPKAMVPGTKMAFPGLKADADIANVIAHLIALTLEHYPDLAEPEIASMLDTAMERFGLSDAMVIHRFGRLLPGEPIMQVITVALHRQAAFDGADFLMDYLKTGAPFWKKEETASGEGWVAAKAEDDDARQRWACRDQQ